MIGFITTIILAFTWLAYETDWMRVRLPCGRQVSVVNQEIHNIMLIRNRFKISEVVSPICGWAWIIAHQHDLDNWRATIELRINGSTHRLSLKPESKGIIKEIIKVNTKPHKVVTEVYRPSHYAWGVAGALTA